MKIALLIAVLIGCYAPFTQGMCANGDITHNWMAGFGAKKPSELLLLGSHDAGTRGPVQSKSFLAKPFSDALAITQTKNIYEQLCASYRVFDIRYGW
jgi:hypothetical protein